MSHEQTGAERPAGAAEAVALRRILADQVARRPRLEIQDLYKFIFQAALGSEHAVRDAAAVRDWLERELREMGAGPEEPAVEPLSPDGRIVRVNLRPYIAAGGDPQALLEAFIHTANAHRGTSAELRRYWETAEQMAKEGQLPFGADELRAFIARMEALGLPAVHHSKAYELAYRPAYRVIAREFFDWP
jgi:hypothetical protein